MHVSAKILVAGLTLALAEIAAAELPPNDKLQAIKLLEVHAYCEGVVFDHEGRGYISHGDRITQFTLDKDSKVASSKVWATTGAPNGHKVLADGTHLVCDASRKAVLLLDADGKFLKNASDMCDGQPVNGPNDLTLDTPHGGFYFTNPADSGIDKQTGTVHYVDKAGVTHLCAGGFAYPNGIVLTPDGKRILMAESQKNRILEFPVTSPGKLGEYKVFCELPKKEGEQIDNQPDGICLDAEGNLYVAHYGMKQVQVLDQTGKVIRRYPGGNVTTSNVAFGGPNHDQVFVTGGLGAEAGGGGVFRLDVGVKGLVILPGKK
jgi:gluconolactonase